MSTYISADITSLAKQLAVDIVNQLVASVPSIESKLTVDDLTNILQNYVENNYGSVNELSFLRPDFEGIKLQLISILREKGSWKDIIQAGVGETLIEFIATIAAYSQGAIQRALQENMLDTARLKSSIYTITRMLGVHIGRKVPSSTLTRLTCEADNKNMRVPKYSQFSINGLNFYNRDDIVFTPQHTSTDVVLYEGTVNITAYTSSGRPFQSFEIGGDDFMVADVDITCIDSNFTEYKRVTNGLWHYGASDKVFYENTTPNGNVECRFGNGVYGAIPTVDTTLNFVYTTTSGSYNDTTRTQLAVTLLAVNDTVASRIRRSTTSDELSERNRVTASVRGYTLEPISGGGDEEDEEFYRALAPFIRRADGRAVTRMDHYAVALTCPEVKIADIYFQGQQELAPANRNFINVVGITALKKNGDHLTNNEKSRFLKWFEERAIWRCQYQWIDPTPVYIDVIANVFCGPGADLPRIESFLEYKLKELMAVRRGSLGYSEYQSDIFNVLKTKYTSMKVDYVDLIEPTIASVVNKTQFVVLQNITLNVNYTDRYYTTAPVANPLNTDN